MGGSSIPLGAARFRSQLDIDRWRPAIDRPRSPVHAAQESRDLFGGLEAVVGLLAEQARINAGALGWRLSGDEVAAIDVASARWRTA